MRVWFGQRGAVRAVARANVCRSLVTLRHDGFRSQTDAADVFLSPTFYYFFSCSCNATLRAALHGLHLPMRCAFTRCNARAVLSLVRISDIGYGSSNICSFYNNNVSGFISISLYSPRCLPFAVYRAHTPRRPFAAALPRTPATAAICCCLLRFCAFRIFLHATHVFVTHCVARFAARRQRNLRSAKYFATFSVRPQSCAIVACVTHTRAQTVGLPDVSLFAYIFRLCNNPHLFFSSSQNIFMDTVCA